MPISIDQSPAHSTSTFTTSKSVTITNPNTNDLIAALIGGRSNVADDNGTITYANDLAGATQGLRDDWLPGGGQKGQWIEVAGLLSDGAETTITVTSSVQQTEMTLKVYVVSGLDVTAVADKSVSNSTDDTQVTEVSTGESAALSKNDAFVIGLLQVYDVITSQTWDTITGDGNSTRTYYGSQIRSAGGTLLEGPQWTTSRRAVCGMVGWVATAAGVLVPSKGSLSQSLKLKL